MLTTIITAYNNTDTITKAIKTASLYSKRIIVVDFNSSDLTLEVVRLNPLVEFITTEEEYAYLDLLNYNDWFLLLKADERLIYIDMDKFKEPYSYLKVEHNQRVDFLPRLFRYKNGMRFAKDKVQIGFNIFDLKNEPEVDKSPVGLIRSQPRDK